MLIGAVCNIVLDPILIFGFHMGVEGAALATIISQGVSAVWVIRFLTGTKTKIRIKRKHLHLRAEVILPVLALGVAPFVMNITESAINVAFNSSLSRYGGDIAVGAMTILASVMQFLFIPAQGLTQGAQPIISFNYGAGKKDLMRVGMEAGGLTQGAQPIISFNYGAGNIERVKRTYHLLIRCCLIYTLGFCVVIELFPGVFVRLFNNNSPELIATTTCALRVYMAGAGIFGIQSAIQSTFMALGQAKLSLFIACMRKLILLIPLIYILPNFFSDKVFAVFMAEPVADVLSVLIASALFAMNINKILEKENNEGGAKAEA